MAGRGNLEASIEQMLNLENQMRLAGDVAKANEQLGQLNQMASTSVVELGSKRTMTNSTLVCTPIMAESVDKMMVNIAKAKASGADLVEIRLDSLKGFDPHVDLKTLISGSPLPML